MIDVKSTIGQANRYGLGIFESNYNGRTYYGHYGFYGTYVGYCPETATVLSYCITQGIPEFTIHGFIDEAITLIESDL